MKAYDNEFDMLMNHFEKMVKDVDSPFYMPMLHRSSRNQTRTFYDNGSTDSFFKMFLCGYEYAKCLHRLDE